MPDIVQRVKYTVQVDATELDAFKTKIDGINTSINTLSTSLGVLKTAVDKALVKSISTLNSRLARMAESGVAARDSMRGLVAPVVGLQGSIDTLANKFGEFSTGLKAALSDLKRVNDELKKVKKESGEGAAAAESYGKTWSMSWLRAFGVFQTAKYTISSAFDEIKEGAQNLDLDKILSAQFKGFQDTIARAQELTAGTVSRGNLTRSYALMSSFGIPMDKFAENMELVQKMAVRTGQSADFLSESFARGISRLSPLILDNLGIQVSLGDANLAYANSTGKLVEELTKEEKIAGLLVQVLDKLKGATKGVDLQTGSLAANISRFEAAWSDLGDKVKGGAGDFIGILDQHFEDATTTVSRFIPQIELLGVAYEKTNDFLRVLGVSSTSFYEDTIGAQEAAFKLFASNEDLADLFGNEGILGTTTTRIGEVLKQQKSAFNDWVTETDRFIDESAKPALERLVDLSEGGRSGSAATAVGGVFANARLSFMSMGNALRDAVVPFEKILTAQDMVALKAMAETRAKKETEQSIKTALWLTTTGLSLSNALYYVYRNQEKTQSATADWMRDQVASLAKQSGLNQALAIARNMQMRDLALELTNSERLFSIQDGRSIAEVNLNDLMQQRTSIMSELEDLQTKYNESKDVETQLQIISKMNDLTAMNVRRQALLAEIAGDKERLASYKGMSRAKLAEDIKAFEVGIKLVQSWQQVNSALGLSNQGNTEIVAEMVNRIKELRTLMEKGGGGGGRASKEEYEPFKAPKSQKPTFYGWTVFDMVEAQGAIKGMYDAMSLPGTAVGGFLGETDFAGAVSREEIDKARVQYDQLRKAREDYVSRFGTENMFEGMFGDPEQMDAFYARLTELEAHVKILDSWATGLDQVATAMQSFRDGMDGLFGDDITGWIGDLTSGIEGFSEALRSNAGAYGMVNAAMPVIRSFTKNLIKNRQAQAAVEALMQGAAAWAAYAEGNIPGGIMHTTAALMYGMVAGGALNLPKGKGKEDKPNQDAARFSQAKMRDIHVHIEGKLMATEAERGSYIRDALREAERQGM